MTTLFDRCYREANHAHLGRAIENLGWVVLARLAGELVGYAVGGYRVLDLPRLPQQPVLLFGPSCVAPELRRRHLFNTLMKMAVHAGRRGPVPERMLLTGRIAHPASFRGWSQNPGVVPRHNVAPTAWQREVGAVLASVLGAKEFDPSTFVCRGSGVPVGYPIMDIEATTAEWEVFRSVDRSRGDALLGITWVPGPPAGWA